MAEKEEVKDTPAAEVLTAEAKKAAAAPAPEKVVPAAEPDPAPAPKEQTVPLSRLQAVIAQKAEAERSREALARELAAATTTLEEFKALGSKKEGEAAPAKTVAAKPLSQEELQRLVVEEGARQVFNQRCNDAVAAGRTAHQDFDKVVLGDLASVSPFVDRTTGRPTIPTPLIEAALETGSAAEVLYALGQNISEASRIMSLRPVAQAVELAKFAAKLQEPTAEDAEAERELEDLKNVSKAPPPIKRAVNKGPTKPAFTIFDTENFSTEEWIKQREKQVRESRAR